MSEHMKRVSGEGYGCKHRIKLRVHCVFLYFNE